MNRKKLMEIFRFMSKNSLKQKIVPKINSVLFKFDVKFDSYKKFLLETLLFAECIFQSDN